MSDETAEKDPIAEFYANRHTVEVGLLQMADEYHRMMSSWRTLRDMYRGLQAGYKTLKAKGDAMLDALRTAEESLSEAHVAPEHGATFADHQGERQLSAALKKVQAAIAKAEGR